MILPSEISGLEIFRDVEPALVARIAQRSAEIRVNTGEWIAHEGDTAYLWIVLEGELESIKRTNGRTDRVTTFEAGEYFGEVPLMLGTPAFMSLRSMMPARLMRIDAADFHNLVAESSTVATLLAQSLSRRVGFIRSAFSQLRAAEATIIGGRYDFACHDIRDFLTRNQIAFDWLDPTDPADRSRIPESCNSSDIYPKVVFPDGSCLELPELRTLAEKLGLCTKPSSECYDVVIVGGGPAGLAAAVYGGSEGLRTILIEREAPGGQAGTSSRIENYLGFPGGVSGGELANRALQQAKRLGTEVLVTRTVRETQRVNDVFRLALDDGTSVHARSVVFATGVRWRSLEAEGADGLIGRGVYYGAARTEAQNTRGKDVYLIGGGNSAGQAAMFFANYAKSVTIMIRGDSIAKSMSYYLIEQLHSKSNITIEVCTKVLAIHGTDHVTAIRPENIRSGAVQTRAADAVFVFIGADADTHWLPEEVERDAHGYIKTGPELKNWQLARAPFPLESNIPGFFVVGDVRSGSVKRVASGVGEGSMAIAFVHQYLQTIAQNIPVVSETVATAISGRDVVMSA